MRIELTRNKYAIVDDEDGELLGAYNWQAIEFVSKSGKVHWYAYRGVTRIAMHREILGLGPRKLDPFDVDHVNGDGLDNRRSNLRVATRAENCSNSHGWTRRKYPFKGVWKTKYDRWVAYRGPTYLGCFPTIEEAARAYDVEMIRTYGPDFPKLNFPKLVH